MSVTPISTIKIDGKLYTPPTVQKDPKGNWVSTPAEGMDEFQKANAKVVNKKGFDGETFMKLLVAQLKYQDPTKPADTGQLMQQTATLSMVERINEMAQSAEAMVKASEALAASNEVITKSYASMAAQQQMSSAVQLVGRTVTYVNPNDPKAPLEGAVESVRFDATGPILVVAGKDVPLAAVLTVRSGPTAPATTTGTTSSGATGTTGTTANTGNTDSTATTSGTTGTTSGGSSSTNSTSGTDSSTTNGATGTAADATGSASSTNATDSGSAATGG